jgi:superfamily I DNA and/or RNA helicase
MKYELKQHLSSPKGYDSQSLFEFCVNILVQKMNDDRYPLNLIEGNDAFENHIQWTNRIFGIGNETNRHYLSKVKSEFGSYFINHGNKYGWNFERIFEEHPHFFKIVQTERNNDPYFEMLKALDHEIIEAKRDTKKNTYRVSDIERINLTTGAKIYVASLDIEEDEDPKLVEDLPITIRIGGLTFDTKVLDYDKVGDKIYFQLDKDLSKFYGNISIQADASWILEKIKERLQTSQTNGSIETPISKFIESKVLPKKISNLVDTKNTATLSLDESQLSAFNFANQHDLSIIWGPPGTGKSHTLAIIIDNFFKKSEKTLVTCIANVAVDSITIKLLDLIERQRIQVKQGEILRIGYTRDKKLLETEYLFPDNSITKNIRQRILQIDEKLQNTPKGQGLELKKVRQDLREKLKNEINSLIMNSKVTFSTASKFFVDSTLNSREYDNLIIDEASMVSIPHFIALGLTIKKRIIITGDFRQLGPVVLSQSEVSKKWLHRDIFEFSGINPKETLIDHPAMKQLLIQRRSHESICNLINRPFYQGKLKSDTKFGNDEIVHMEPFKGKIIVYKRLDANNKVEFTRKGSRLNRNSAKVILNLLDIYSQYDSLNNTIGIVTPYRGQVKLIQELIALRKYPIRFRELIKVGTIHAFQGSECDLIIFDTVDSITENIGKLYNFDIGKRLVNVALSRAKHKLIVCGDLEVFTHGKGHTNIDPSLDSIFNTLKRYQTNE